MIVTLELSAEETQALNGVAEAAGVSLETVLHSLIARVSPPKQDALAASTPPADPEALGEQKREQEEMEANVKRWHAERAQTERIGS